MTLTHLLSFCLLLICSLFGFSWSSKGKFRHLHLYLFGFSLLVGLSLVVLHHYIYPAADIYKNSSYHLLEHKGYHINSFPLQLINGDSSRLALWDNKSGRLSLHKDSSGTVMSYANCFLPIYQKTEVTDSKNNYRLVNEGYSFPFKKGLTIYSKDSLDTFVLKKIDYTKAWQENKLDSVQYAFKRSKDTAWIYSDFKGRILKGYQLNELFENSLDFPDDLDGTALVRGQVCSPLLKPSNAFKESENPLRFFISQKILEKYAQISIDGGPPKPIEGRLEGQVNLLAEDCFFVGLFRNKSDLMTYKQDSIDRLEYAFPKRFPLKSDDSLSTKLKHFISSNAKDFILYDLESNQAPGGYYLNNFINEDNEHNINAILRYHIGHSKEKIRFQITDLKQDNSLLENLRFEQKTNEDFILATSSRKLSWEFQLKDCRTANPMKIGHLQLFLLVFWFLVMFRYLLPIFYNSSYLFRVELAIYPVLYCLLFIRLLLQWRISTFYPLDENYGQHLHLVEKMWSPIVGHFQSTVWLSLSFFALWLVLIWRKIKKQDHHSWHLGGWMLLGFCGLSFVVPLDLLSRISHLFAPLLIYYTLDQLLINISPSSLPSKQQSWTLKWRRKIPTPAWAPDFKEQAFTTGLVLSLDRWLKKIDIHLFDNQWLLRVFLFLLTALVLTATDSGYAIMFYLYAYIHFFIAYPIINAAKWSKRPFRYHIGLLCSITLLAFLIYYQNVAIGWLLSKNNLLGYYNIYWAFVLIFFVFIPVVAIILQIKRELFFELPWLSFSKSLALKIKLLLGSYGIILALTILFNQPINNVIERYSYIKYRAEILDTSVDDLILENSFGSKDVQQIQRAAHNQWLINFFLLRGEKKEKYFQLQPHFTQGASHFTQSNDLVIPRYLIAEHGTTILLLLNLLLMLLAFIYYHSLNKEARKSPHYFSLLGILLLLATSAIFVGLTATNRLTFFGQDFPIIPVASKITLILTYGLLVFLLAQLEPESEGKESFLSRTKLDFKLLYPLFLLIGLSMSIYSFNRNADNSKEAAHYNISKVIDKASAEINNLNTKLKQLQQQDTLGRGIDSLLLSFHGIDEKGTIKLNLINDESKNKFFSTAYKHFLANADKKRNQEDFIHLRRRNGIDFLALNRRFFFIQSPEGVDNQWNGHLLAAKTKLKTGLLNGDRKFVDQAATEKQHVIANLNQLIEPKGAIQNIKIVYFPESWSADSIPIYLIRQDFGRYPSNRTTFQIQNEKFNFTTSNAIGKDTTYYEMNENQRAIRLLLNDEITFINEKDKQKSRTDQYFRLLREKRHFLARNMWINGNQRLYYPLGKEFSWSYSYANLVKSVNPEKKNETVSIDYKLTTAAYNWLNKHAHASPRRNNTPLLAFRDAPFDQKISGEHLLFRLEGDQIFLRSEDNYTEYEGKYSSFLDEINRQLSSSKGFSDIDKNDHIINTINSLLKGRFDASVVAMDGNGRLRLLTDYHKIPRVDPNNIIQYYAFLNTLYQSSSIASEIDYFGNIGLLNNVMGMGSTFKPFVYASVTSQSKQRWGSLKIKDENKNTPSLMELDQKSKQNALKYFAGRRFPSKVFWTNIPYGDFSNEGLKAKRYLTKSNNIHHGTILMLGSFTPDQLKVRRSKSDILRRSGTNIQNDFPRFSFGGAYYSFKTWPNFNTRKSALAKGLYQNFNLVISANNKDHKGFSSKAYRPFQKHSKPYYEYGAKNSNNYFYWSFPEWSDFLQIDREVTYKERNGLIQPALGAFPVSLSPLKMAEMGIGLFTTNRKFQASLNDEQQNDYEFFGHDQKWSEKGLSNFYRNYIYEPLYEATKSGTASGLKGLNEKYNKGTKQLWFYAKTGTTGKSNEKLVTYKRLLVVITNKPVHLKAVNKEKLKIYSIFITIDNINKGLFYSTFKGDWAGITPLIEKIVDSETFKDYMYENNQK